MNVSNRQSVEGAQPLWQVGINVASAVTTFLLAGGLAGVVFQCGWLAPAGALAGLGWCGCAAVMETRFGRCSRAGEPRGWARDIALSLLAWLWCMVVLAIAAANGWFVHSALLEGGGFVGAMAELTRRIDLLQEAPWPYAVALTTASIPGGTDTLLWCQRERLYHHFWLTPAAAGAWMALCFAGESTMGLAGSSYKHVDFATAWFGVSPEHEARVVAAMVLSATGAGLIVLCRTLLGLRARSVGVSPFGYKAFALPGQGRIRGCDPILCRTGRPVPAKAQGADP